MLWLFPRTRAVVALCVVAVALNACGGGGGHTTPGSPVPGPSPSPTTGGIVPGNQPTIQPSPSATGAVNSAAYICPTSDTSAAVARGTSAADEMVRRAPLRRRTAALGLAAAQSQLIAVTYDARVAGPQKTALALRESALGITRVREYTFAHAQLVTHVLAVRSADVNRVESVLRQGAGVRAVGLTGARRYATSVNQPYYSNDPYFTGFSTTNAPPTGGTPPPSTFETGPLVESADVPGQWDMHVTQLEYAFGYSQANNGSGVSNAGALGSAAVKIAVIDTGEDTTQPELTSKIAYQRCFITNPSTNVQSTSTFTTDPSGHGTNVAGIAGAATSNGVGFTGAGGRSALYGYRVFPTPNDSCTSDTSTDNQCGTSSSDVASAILDAVNAHVNVISMSLGGTGCSNGVDPDPAEGAAVADAIAANIVVVAAAGNSSGPPVEAPGCDPGVIAVGATGLADGQPNASNVTGGSPTSPFEYVASYSDYGSPGASPGSSAAWGIVAPGGDPTGANDADDLHWINNIWTSQPFMATTIDTNFAGDCQGDYPAHSGSADCRVFIAGTSMATPHVAGAAALIIAANPSYQSPTLMKQLLCLTADDIADPSEGCGRLNIYRAMATAVGDTTPPPANPIP